MNLFKEKILVILLVVLSFGCWWSANVLAGPEIFLMAKQPTGGGGTCTIGSGDNWVNADTSDSYDNGATGGIDDANGQSVYNSSSKNICKVKIYFRNTGLDSNTYVKLKSAWGGTLYGTSDTQSVLGNSTITQYTFTFSSSVTVPGNFVVVVVTAQAYVNMNFAYSSSGGAPDKYFGGTSYKGRHAGSDVDQDVSMEIWYEQ